MKELIFYTDGYTVGGNPSKIGGGYVILDGNGKPIFQEYFEKSGMTNNETELLGLAKALELAPAGSTVYTDSFCAFAWILRGKCKARPDLSDIAAKGQYAMRSKGLDMRQCGRERNLAGMLIENEQINGRYLKDFVFPVNE